MISICIPIYNREMCDTVRLLANQAAQAGMPCEIVCIDDCSDTCYREANRPLHGMCRYVELERLRFAAARGFSFALCGGSQAEAPRGVRWESVCG